MNLFINVGLFELSFNKAQNNMKKCYFFIFDGQHFIVILLFSIQYILHIKTNAAYGGIYRKNKQTLQILCSPLGKKQMYSNSSARLVCLPAQQIETSHTICMHVSDCFVLRAYKAYANRDSTHAQKTHSASALRVDAKHFFCKIRM